MDGVGTLSRGEGIRDGSSTTNILLPDDIPTSTNSRPYHDPISFESYNLAVNIECSFKI